MLFIGQTGFWSGACVVAVVCVIWVGGGVLFSYYFLLFFLIICLVSIPNSAFLRYTVHAKLSNSVWVNIASILGTSKWFCRAPQSQNLKADLKSTENFFFNDRTIKIFPHCNTRFGETAVEKSVTLVTAKGTQWENAQLHNQYLKIKTELDNSQLSQSHALC